MPAPGHTMSTCPNSCIPTSNMRSSCGQSVTSVLRKTARGFPCSFVLYPLTSCSASGRSERSAIRTEQPWLRSKAAKEKLIPDPAPVTMALLPLTLNAFPGFVRLVNPGCLAAMVILNLLVTLLEWITTRTHVSRSSAWLYMLPRYTLSSIHASNQHGIASLGNERGSCGVTRTEHYRSRGRFAELQPSYTTRKLVF